MLFKPPNLWDFVRAVQGTHIPAYSGSPQHLMHGRCPVTVGDVNTHVVGVSMPGFLAWGAGAPTPSHLGVPQGQGKLGLFPSHEDRMISPSSGSRFPHRSPWCPLTSPLLDGSVGHTTTALTVSSVTTAPVPTLKLPRDLGPAAISLWPILFPCLPETRLGRLPSTSPLAPPASSASHTQGVFIMF